MNSSITKHALSEPNVERAKVKFICFSDCKDAPGDSSEHDLIVLKDGRRKSGEITLIEKGSYNSNTKTWDGSLVRLSGEDYENIPFSEIRYIKFSDHVFYSLRQALSAPAEAHRLVLHGDFDASLNESEVRTNLRHLSSQLGRMTNLKELDIACLENVKDLPTEIGNLRKLEKLILDNGNGCIMNVSLPPSIGQLQRLRVLILYGALHKGLPNTIANLQNLEELNLGHNDIRAVPPAVASLHKLRRLSLDWDEIPQLPPFIGNLTNLRELSLMSTHGPNRTIVLPQSLAALKGLKVFMGNNFLKLKDQERLRKRFPNIIFSFENEYDSNDDANEAPASSH